MHVLKAIAVMGCALCLMAQTHAPDPLSQARQFYNDGRYDEAIRLSTDARAIPEFEAAARIIIARAHLDRFRRSSQMSDLDSARGVLTGIDASALSPRDRVELLIALGASLYLDETYDFDDRFSAAAEQFELALAHADTLDTDSRDQLFDWWAAALDRQAQQGSEAGRVQLYTRILQRAEQELDNSPYAVAASYWLAASARGTNDLTRAMGAAVAGWVRASAVGPRGASLRSDLDRLMRQVVLPERARELVPNGDVHLMLALLEAQWRQVQEKWAGTQ